MTDVQNNVKLVVTMPEIMHKQLAELAWYYRPRSMNEQFVFALGDYIKRTHQMLSDESRNGSI